MEITQGLITRPPSPPPFADVRDKLDRAYESLLTEGLQMRLERVQRTGSPPRRVSPYALFWRATLAMDWEKRHPFGDGRSVSVTPPGLISVPYTPTSSSTNLTSPSPSLTNDQGLHPPQLPQAQPIEVSDLIKQHSILHHYEKLRRSQRLKQRSTLHSTPTTPRRVSRKAKSERRKGPTRKRLVGKKQHDGVEAKGKPIAQAEL